MPKLPKQFSSWIAITGINYQLKKNDPSLRKLDLRGKYVSENGAKKMSDALRHNTHLEELVLYSNNIDGINGARAIADMLCHNKSLLKLDFGTNRVGDVGVALILESLADNSTLLELCMPMVGIGNANAEIIAKTLSRNTSLQSLGLQNNSIGAKGAAAIGSTLATNNTMRTLNLGGNKIGNDGVTKIAEALESNETLRELVLWNNNIGNDGAKRIAKALLRNHTLTTIDLSGNDDVTDDEVKQNIIQLLELNLSAEINHSDPEDVLRTKTAQFGNSDGEDAMAADSGAAVVTERSVQDSNNLTVSTPGVRLANRDDAHQGLAISHGNDVLKVSTGVKKELTSANTENGDSGGSVSTSNSAISGLPGILSVSGGSAPDKPQQLTDTDGIKLTDDDLLFMKMGRELVKGGGDIPKVSDGERCALKMVTANMADIERALETVKELPSSLAGKGDEVESYFFCFTSAFERAYVAAQAINSGSVKLESDMATNMLEVALHGVSYVAEKSALPIVGFISILSTIIMHHRNTKKSNMLCVFEEFFRGKCHVQYVLTYRKLAEQFCLRRDIPSLTRSEAGTVSKMKEGLKKNIVEPIRDHLRKVHLDAIHNLDPFEEMAMADLASLTEEVLRLHQDDIVKYDKLRECSEEEKVAHFVRPRLAHTGSGVPQSAQALSNQSPSGNTPLPYTGSVVPKSVQPLSNQAPSGNAPLLSDQLKKLEGKIQQLEKENAKLQSDNSRKDRELKEMQAELRKLKAKINSEEDVTVSNGRHAQAFINPSTPTDEAIQVETRVNSELEILNNTLYHVQMEIKKIKLENFISNKILRRVEAIQLAKRIIEIPQDVNGKMNTMHVTVEGSFEFQNEEYCIGMLTKGRSFLKQKSIWEGKNEIKVEEKYQGTESIMWWFDKMGLGSIYERNSKAAMYDVFIRDELCQATSMDLLPSYAENILWSRN